MKGGLVQMVSALRVIRDLDLQMSLEPIVFINSDEEIGSRTSTRYVRTLARCVERAFVLEPAMGEEGMLKTERKGIGRFTITVHGKAAHAGLDPEGGASAILELSHVIQTLFALNDADKGITVNVGTIDGGLQPNVIAPHSQAVVDVRVPTLADGDRIEKEIHSLEPSTPGVRLTIEGRIGRPSMEFTPRNDALWHKARQLRDALAVAPMATRPVSTPPRSMASVLLVMVRMQSVSSCTLIKPWKEQRCSRCCSCLRQQKESNHDRCTDEFTDANF
jgi:glutamate carboxypeptidase